VWDTLDLRVIGSLLVLVPVLFALASWALQLACAFCAVEPPPYWHCTLIMVAILAANYAVQYLFLEQLGVGVGIWTTYLVPVLTSGIVIALTAPTPLFSALGVAAVHVAFCAGVTLGLEGLCSVLAVAAVG
jgi:hypothetical protein